MRSQFPQELVDEILDHFDIGDSETLKACSLVGRAWVFRARSILFRKCFIHPATIRTFRDLSRSKNCTFKRHIRSIDVTRHCGDPNDHLFTETAPDVVELVGVRDLQMSFTCTGPHAFYCTVFVAAFPRVTRLTIRFEDHLDQPMPIIEMICLLPALQELYMQWMKNDIIANPPPSAIPPHGLHAVHFDGGPSVVPILTWLTSTDHLHNLDSITFSQLNDSEFQIVHESLRQLGPNLHHLELDLYGMILFYVDPSAVFDLTLHPNLQTLTIRDDMMEQDTLFQVITRLVAPNLERLSVHFDPHLGSDSENWDKWAALDPFFNATRFPSLQSVTFICYRPEEVDDDTHDDTRLRASLPLLVASGKYRTGW
ncbi:hypothetical protein MSAN_02313300 [Mycena sanguinolenta]|uniref:F-box domain-containing protein n=1 Tax=Mycena sanguinolenta TaxID=230812 RepID=A0A8H7CGZ6_9AGAR|nr:hypothetical protein MSAN_02313300 [Mycena sanguinolenta]